MIMQKRSRWLAHFRRMDDSRITKTILFSETRDCSRKQGHPLLRYLYDCKHDMKLFDMNIETWEEYAMQCSIWKEKVTMGVRRYEHALIQRKEENRTRRKQPLTNMDVNDDAFICEHCNKRCRIGDWRRIGLFSHVWTHRTCNVHTLIFKIDGCLQHIRTF